MWSVLLLSLNLIYATTAHPVSNDVQPLSYEQLQRIINWKEDDKQNIWELSGQFEGDIILDENQRNGIIGDSYRWPNKTISYMFAPEFTDEHKQIINDGLSVLTSNTCIKTKVITEAAGDYVYITGNTAGCNSRVGRRGGEQEMSLQIGTSCLTAGTAQHEFLHALGFYHQHSASERNEYITIHYENIRYGAAVNFRRENSNNFGTIYDYGSLLHYSAYAFSKNGERTIETTDPNAVIGQREGVTNTDLEKLRLMYNCE